MPAELAWAAATAYVCSLVSVLGYRYLRDFNPLKKRVETLEQDVHRLRSAVSMRVR